MAEPYDTYRYQYENAATSVYQKFGRISSDFFDLYEKLTTEGNPISGLKCYEIRTEWAAMQGSWGLGTSTYPGRLLQILDYFADNIGGGGVDMASILTAMLAATAEEITQFMGITQAFKVAVWDAPFNEEYYAALARGFKKWGA